MDIFAKVSALLAAHPSLSMLLFPLCTFLVTWLFGAHSEDDYARLPVPVAHFARFCASFGASQPAIMAFVRQLFGKPPSPPAAMLLLAFSAMGAGVTFAACANMNAQTVHDIEAIALNAEQAACVLTADIAGQNEPAAVAKLCQIPPAFLEQVVTLLSAKAKAQDPKYRAKVQASMPPRSLDASSGQ